MTIYLPELGDTQLLFPSPEEALKEPNGLLAMGGDLSAPRLLSAYSQGIFPWFSNHDPILWWSPSPRAVIMAKQFRPAKSLKKFVKKSDLTVTLNHATEQVIRLCASTRPASETWITKEMQQAYIQLARLGHCHSVEVWQQQQLIGGLYGLNLGKVFCGESMFSLQSNASKVAFWYLCNHFSAMGGEMIDCQVINDHLTSLGVSEISRQNFLIQLNQLQQQTITEQSFIAQTLTLYSEKN